MQMPNTEALRKSGHPFSTMREWIQLRIPTAEQCYRSSPGEPRTNPSLKSVSIPLRSTVNTNSGANAGFSANASSPVAGFDPVLISLIRRAMPNLVAYDLAGVQPMSGPTGLIFAMRSRYTDRAGTEALFNEADTAFAGQDPDFDRTNGFTNAAVGMGTTAQSGSNPGLLNPESGQTASTYNVGQGMRTDDAEGLGDTPSHFQRDGILDREGHRYC